MGRHRKLEAEAILESAEQVMLERGLGKLTLEAVASRAGISKATVLYDYKTKDALVFAMIRRLLEEEMERYEEMKAMLPERDAGILSRIAVSDRRLSDEDRATAMMVIAALTNDGEVKALASDFFRQSIDDVVATAGRPRGALLAFLALHGLRNLECFGFVEWSPEEFRGMLEDIEWLARQDPGDPSAP